MTSREKTKNILFNQNFKETRKKYSIMLMGHWNNDTGCMPIEEEDIKKIRKQSR